MTGAIRPRSNKPLSAEPECPTCRDASFVSREQIITGGRPVAFWTCSSCLRSWSAPARRMAKVDLVP